MLNSLRAIVQAVAAASDFSHAVGVLVRDVRSALGVEVCSVFLKDRHSDRLVMVGNEGLADNAVGQAILEAGQGLVGQVAKRAEPINLDNAPEHPNFHYIPQIDEDAFRAFLGVPIIHHRDVLGVLVVQQRTARRFDEAEEAFLVTLSAQLAAVVAHAQATGDVDALTNENFDRRNACFQGVAGSPGIAIGQAVVLKASADLAAVPEREAEDVTVELMLFDRAIDAARAEIEGVGQQLASALPPEELALFDVYLHMLDDAAMADDVRNRIRRGQWAQGALKQVIFEHVGRFEEMDDTYLRERGSDVKELGQRVLSHMQDMRRRKQHFPDNAILVSEEVTPSMLAEIPADKLAGVVSMRGAGNSHVAILARALDVPTVMGAIDLPIYQVDGSQLVVDGFYGEVITEPDERALRRYGELMEAERGFNTELESLRDLPCVTEDGHRLRLWVNIGLVSDISRSLDRGAEGIGLFRTEVPFITSDRFPTEQEQRALYREHMEAFEPRPVTMRTLDIGGDKSLSYFPIVEENPFLGWRGVRVTLDHPEIFLVQVRAMLKANEGLKGDLRIMLPMISSVDETLEAKALVEQAYAEVLDEGLNVKTPLVGVMIEVPAAVYQARALAREVDFLAVGSNDLTQYMLAVDRNNPRVAELFRETHPAVITALRDVARAARAERKPIGICGEFAGTPAGAVLCMAMGFDVLSMNATNLPRVKWVIRNIKRREARTMLSEVLKMGTTAEVDRYVREQMTELGLGRVLPSHASD
ncbi:MAG: phosphoenolpyruvate--protein phosphotransferase [Pseudomonadaceae bacterium]|nr:phosphoenolpyruvate--protein phosphotransferase [Pseudomonadaceae bacterium]